MSSVINTGIFILIFLMTLTIPVLIGVFVYRDSAKRNMNAVLWTLIAVLAPTFIGLIIYLIVRADHSPLKCPSCSQTVTDRYTVCPKCGAKLKLTCDKCSFPVEPQWHICPNCAEPLPENQKSPLPAPRNDKGLVGILIAVILIPIALCIVLILALAAPQGGSVSYSSAMFTGNLNKAELCKVDAVKSWLSDCDQTGDGIYVLAYKSKEYKTQTYLIYRKGAANMADTQINSSSEGFFRKPVNILTYSTLGDSNAVGYDISYLFLLGEPGELKINENGSDAAYSIIESDVNWPEMISAYISAPDLNEPASSEPAGIEIQNSTSS